MDDHRRLLQIFNRHFQFEEWSRRHLSFKGLSFEPARFERLWRSQQLAFLRYLNDGAYLANFGML
jgi:hypothetical protein